MKNGEVIREILLNNTIRLIGEKGFESATTKNIVHTGTNSSDIRLNEVYIYRIFGSKELLYSEAFSTLDKELFSFVGSIAQRFQTSSRSFEEKMYFFFDQLWRFLLGNEARCRCYVRFYYSAYFRENALREHRKLLRAQRPLFTPIFKDESDVIALIHTTFMTMMDFAIRVYNGDIENTEENVGHIFQLLYNSLISYFNPTAMEKPRN